MKTWWNNLSLREQKLVLFGGLGVGIIILYFFIWQPINNQLNQYQTNIAANKNLITWMQQAVPELKNLKQKVTQAQDIPASQMLSSINTSLKKSPIKNAVTQIAQQGDGKVLVKFNSVGFDALITWLTETWKQSQIQTQELSITPKARIGLVQAQMVLAK